MTRMTTKIDYTLLGKVENEIRSSNYLLDDIHYLEQAQLVTFVESGFEEAFREWMTNLTSGQATIMEDGQLYNEYDV